MAKPRPTPPEQQHPQMQRAPSKHEAEETARAWGVYDQLVEEFAGKVDFLPNFDTDKGRFKA